MYTKMPTFYSFKSWKVVSNLHTCGWLAFLNISYAQQGQHLFWHHATKNMCNLGNLIKMLCAAQQYLPNKQESVKSMQNKRGLFNLCQQLKKTAKTQKWLTPIWIMRTMKIAGFSFTTDLYSWPFGMLNSFGVKSVYLRTIHKSIGLAEHRTSRVPLR